MLDDVRFNSTLGATKEAPLANTCSCGCNCWCLCICFHDEALKQSQISSNGSSHNENKIWNKWQREAS